MKGLRLALLTPILAACIGRATPPEQVKLTQQQNEVLGKFARQVGEKEINILLKDPNDTTLPGLPVGDLLYILSKVNEDKLITLVKGISATYTLELILAIKRVGCTRANTVPTATGYGFDATSVASINTCKWNHFHLPNIMVQLLNGVSTNGLQTLIDTVKHSNTTLSCASNTSGFLDADQPLCPSTSGGAVNSGNNLPYDATVAHYQFLMKLAYIVVGFDTPTSADPNLASENLIGPPKLYNLMNLTLDGRDMVFLLDSFDRNVCPGVAATTSSCVYVNATNTVTTYAAAGDLWQDITSNSQFQDLQNLLNIIAQVNNTTKMGTLVNGRRTARYNIAQDDAQIRYFTDRLRVVMTRTTACIATAYPVSTAAQLTAIGVVGAGPQALFQGEERIRQDISNPRGGASGWNTKLATIINQVTNVDRMMDLIYNIEDGFDINHNSILACPARGIDNLMVLLNNINNDPSAHASAAITQNNEVLTVSYLIDNVTLYPTDADPRRRNKVKYLVEFMGNTLDVLKLACYESVADHVNGVYPATAADICDDRGLINQVAAGSKVDDSAVTDLGTAGRKLANMADQINEIEDMRFLVRKVSMSNMTQIINGLQIASTINVANLVNQIQGPDCWEENGGVITIPAFSYGLGYAASVSNPGPLNTYTGNFVINPLPGGGANQLIKAIVETDTVNHPTFVGRVRAFVNVGSGTGYATGTYSDGNSTMTYRGGNCNYNPPTAYRGFPTTAATGATGLGKMVNVINHITGSPGTIVTLINGVTDGNKLGILINGINRSSNLVGVVNATVDASRNNNAGINDLISLMNSISREDVFKMVHLLENFGDSREINSTITVPSGDHDMVAQLFAAYNQANISTTAGLGSAAMAELIGSLNLTGGNGYTNGATMTITGGTAGTNGTAEIVTTVAGTVSGVSVVTRGVGCTSAPTVNFSGGGGSGAAATAYIDTPAQQLVRVSVTNGGGSFTAAPAVTFTGGGCTTAPTGTAFINRIGTATITNAGTLYTNNPTTCTVGGGAGATLTCVASGSIATLNSYYGGSGYVAGQVCPIRGAGGSGATCTVTETGGVLTGCSAIGNDPTFPAGGINYADNRIVKIGGRAEAVVTVAGGIVTGITITNSGCGYAAVPVIEVLGCTVAPTFNVTIPGGRVSATVATGGTVCPIGAKVVIGENPFVAFGDGASAVVDTISNGTLTSVSVAEPAVNAAQLIQLIDRDATGITSGTRGFSISYNGSTPVLSAREALVRLIHHGVTPGLTTSKAVFNGAGGIGPGTLTMDWPGLGPRYLAGSVLNNLTGVTPTQTLINMVNTNSIDLVDTVILLGCGDRSTYTNGWVPNSWQQLCTAVGPGIW